MQHVLTVIVVEVVDALVFEVVLKVRAVADFDFSAVVEVGVYLCQVLFSGEVAFFSVVENGVVPILVVVTFLVPVPVGVRVDRVSGGSSFNSIDDLFNSAGLSVTPS